MRDELLRDERLRVDPPRGRDLPGADRGERERECEWPEAPAARCVDHGLDGVDGTGASHAGEARRAVDAKRAHDRTRCATATIAAAVSARSPSRNCNVAGVSVCGSSPATAVPRGRLALTIAVRVVPAGAVGVTSTATRLVYALTR